MKICKLFVVLFLSLSSLRLYSNIMMDNDSVYYDYVEYELPVLSVSDDNIYEMFESIVANTTNCEEDSKSFDIDKISYILEVGKMKDYTNKEDSFYVEAYEENDIINYIDNGEYYGVLYFNGRLFFVMKKYAEKYFTKTSQTKTFTLSKRNNTPKPKTYHNGNVLHEIMSIQDPPMIWLFVYSNDGKIKLKERGTCCDNIPDISNYMIED